MNFDQSTQTVIMSQGKLKAANSSIFSLQKWIMQSLFFSKQYFSFNFLFSHCSVPHSQQRTLIKSLLHPTLEWLLHDEDQEETSCEGWEKSVVSFLWALQVRLPNVLQWGPVLFFLRNFTHFWLLLILVGDTGALRKDPGINRHCFKSGQVRWWCTAGSEICVLVLPNPAPRPLTVAFCSKYLNEMGLVLSAGSA